MGKIKIKLIKAWQWEKNFKNGIMILYLRYELFNPFAKRPPQEILSKFEIFPRIGIGIRRNFVKGNFESFNLVIGWLVFRIDFSLHWLKRIIG